MFMTKCGIVLLSLLVSVLGLQGQMEAAPLFFDDFTSVASPLWGNQTSSWSVTSDEYGSPIVPNGAHSLLPFGLQDFDIDLDVRNVRDGGVWLHSALSSSLIGVQGVLLVTGAGPTSGTGLYWHIVPDGPGAPFGPPLNVVSGLFNPGDDIHLHISVVGDTYSVFLNGGLTAVASLTTPLFPSGLVGLYDNDARQRFDNVAVNAVPEPATLALFATGMLGLLGYGWKRKKRTT